VKPGLETRSLPYVAALDGVRAIAVTAVLLYHAGVPGVPGGFLGVDLFFVLSGFLITSLLLRELGGSGRIDLGRFWVRRARRLLPAAFLVIAVCLVAAAIFLPGEAARTRADALAAFVYVNNWEQILADHSYFVAFQQPSLLQHLWSLAVEEQFYLLWPLVLGLCLGRLGRRWTIALTLAGVLLSAAAMALLFTPGEDASRAYFGTDTHASGLLVGALLAFAWPLGRFHAAPRKSAAALLDAAAVAGLVAVLAAMVTWHDVDPIVYRGGLLAFAVAAAVLLAAVSHPACRAGALLGVLPLRWIGARSYGIYLWHWPVMALTRPDVDVALSRWILVPLQIGAVVALAAASYRWVEQPVRSGRAGRALKEWLDRRAPRRRLAIAGAAALSVTAALVWAVGVWSPGERGAAFATTPTTAASSRIAPQATRHAPGRPLAVGASVMLASESALGRHMTVDAAVGRQASDVIARLERYRAADRLPRRVVVQVGENGPIGSDEIRALRETLRDVQRVVLVNVRVPRTWVAETNDVLTRAVKGWPQARVADWYDASAGADLLYDDATHPTPQGRRVYARIVRQALQG
jgi:peptidoglycan/LPS O-acetylase OafA/YrhL